jgi:hypothetical protein
VEELVKKVAEKAGISGEQAQKAVQSVMDFLKEKVPMLGDQLKGMLEGGGGGLGNIAEKIGDMLGGKKG